MFFTVLPVSESTLVLTQEERAGLDAVLLEPTVITAEDVLTDDRISLEGCSCTRSNPPLFLCLLARFRREVAPQAVEVKKRNSVQQRATPSVRICGSQTPEIISG